MIDGQGYRAGIGVIIVNADRRLFWARRIGQDAWQFPQGGIKSGETPIEAMYRELYEEVGLTADSVTVIAECRRWLRYRLPHSLIRNYEASACIGQKQKWFLLGLTRQETEFSFDKSKSPEFDAFRWVSYWYPLKQVIYFKRYVYQAALREFLPYVKERRGFQSNPTG